MTKFGLAALVGSALSAAVIGLAAPAVAAPSGDQHTVTVDSLGYRVGTDSGTVDAIQRD